MLSEGHFVALTQVVEMVTRAIDAQPPPAGGRTVSVLINFTTCFLPGSCMETTRALREMTEARPTTTRSKRSRL